MAHPASVLMFGASFPVFLVRACSSTFRQGLFDSFDEWRQTSVAPGRLRLFMYCYVQHGHGLSPLLHSANLRPEVIYSPFFDALLGFSRIPQLITCHDLTPLSHPNSRKAWLKYRLWQPRHLACATRVVAISRHVADQLISFGMAPDRVVVVPNGIEVLRPLQLRY